MGTIRFPYRLSTERPTGEWRLPFPFSLRSVGIGRPICLRQPASEPLYLLTHRCVPLHVAKAKGRFLYCERKQRSPSFHPRSWPLCMKMPSSYPPDPTSSTPPQHQEEIHHQGIPKYYAQKIFAKKIGSHRLVLNLRKGKPSSVGEFRIP